MFYLELYIIILYWEKKVYENVMYYIMIYRVYFEKW